MNGRASKPPLQGSRALTPRSKVWLEVDGHFAVGEGGIALLDAIRSKGSLRQAATIVGWSYRHAWDYLRRMETALGLPLIARQRGRPREGSQLTGEGAALLQALWKLQQAVRAETERAFRLGLHRGGRREAKGTPRTRPSGPASPAP